MTQSPLVLGLDTASDRWHATLRILSGTGSQIIGLYRASIDDPNPDVRRAHLTREFRYALNSIRQPFHVFAEEPIALKNGKTTRLLGLAAGALWGEHLEINCFWHWVEINTWKAHAGMKDYREAVAHLPDKKRSKEQIVLCSMDRHGGDPEWEQDHHDTNLISLYGADMLLRSVA